MATVISGLFQCSACGEPSPARGEAAAVVEAEDSRPGAPVPDRAGAMARHDRALEALGTTRQTLAAHYREAESEAERARVRERARKELEAAIIEDVFPAWMGMPWGMSSTSTATRPHETGKTIGCSYFVTSVLQSAGVELENRYTFAQAPALHIQRSLAPRRDDLHTYFSIPAQRLHDGIAKLGDGLYIIGLDTHVGFVVVRGDQVRLVHASYTDARVVTDEPLLTARAIENSRPQGYFVTPLFRDGRLMDMWLRGQPVPFQRLGA